MADADSPPRRPAVAVIGGGFSGLMTALHVLADASGPSVLLLEKCGTFGRGAAYSAPNPDHRLNVRAGNMSAWPDRPDHFVEWLKKTRSSEEARELFASRGEYGRYLQEQLAGAIRGGAVGRLTLAPYEAARVTPEGGGWRVETAVGRVYHVDAVVLAIGAGSPAPLPGLDEAATSSTRYGADPWSLRLPSKPLGEAPILIAGAGLTMVDMVLDLAAKIPDASFLALSRRGLWPLEHAEAASPALPPPPDPGGPAEILLWLKRQAKSVGWRTAVDAIRPVTQTLWSSWSLKERARFLRHARPYWDVHRHRLAPEVARRLNALRAEGRLSLLRGRLIKAAPVEDGLDIWWRPRGDHSLRNLKVGLLVNCTGLSSPLSKGGGLLADLAKQGLVRHDALGLGLDADRSGRLIGGAGEITPGLFGIGPSIRGVLWEIIAVPDIRNQAPQVAKAAADHAAAAYH